MANFDLFLQGLSKAADIVGKNLYEQNMLNKQHAYEQESTINAEKRAEARAARENLTAYQRNIAMAKLGGEISVGINKATEDYKVSLQRNEEQHNADLEDAFNDPHLHNYIDQLEMSSQYDQAAAQQKGLLYGVLTKIKQGDVQSQLSEEEQGILNTIPDDAKTKIALALNNNAIRKSALDEKAMSIKYHQALIDNLNAGKVSWGTSAWESAYTNIKNEQAKLIGDIRKVRDSIPSRIAYQKFLKEQAGTGWNPMADPRSHPNWVQWVDKHGEEARDIENTQNDIGSYLEQMAQNDMLLKRLNMMNPKYDPSQDQATSDQPVEQQQPTSPPQQQQPPAGAGGFVSKVSRGVRSFGEGMKHFGRSIDAQRHPEWYGLPKDVKITSLSFEDEALDILKELTKKDIGKVFYVSNKDEYVQVVEAKTPGEPSSLALNIYPKIKKD